MLTLVRLLFGYHCIIIIIIIIIAIIISCHRRCYRCKLTLPSNDDYYNYKQRIKDRTTGSNVRLSGSVRVDGCGTATLTQTDSIRSRAYRKEKEEEICHVCR